MLKPLRSAGALEVQQVLGLRKYTSAQRNAFVTMTTCVVKCGHVSHVQGMWAIQSAVKRCGGFAHRR